MPKYSGRMYLDTPTTPTTDQQIEKHVLKITDQILKRLEKQCDNDPYTGIAALAAAICSLARASGTPRSEIDKLLTIIEEDMKEIL